MCVLEFQSLDCLVGRLDSGFPCLKGLWRSGLHTKVVCRPPILNSRPRSTQPNHNDFVVIVELVCQMSLVNILLK